MTRSVAFTRSRTGERIDFVTSRVSSSEIVNATSTATITSRPRSDRDARPFVERPLTTTPVTTLMSGSEPSSFQRSDTPVPTPEKSGGSCAAISWITGRSAISAAKKWRIVAYAIETIEPANTIGSE